MTMKKSIVLVLLLMLTIESARSQQCPTLLWNDEFDGNELNATKWTAQIGDGCDLGICGWGNAELQYYRQKNIRVRNGSLRIRAVQEEYRGSQYTSSRIRSLGLGDIDLSQPVRVEARAKVPAGGQGLWSAIWMLPSQHELTTWPKNGEIDFLEFIGRRPDLAQGFFHYGDAYNDKSQRGGPLELTTSPSEDYHVYGFEKTPNQISFFVDGYMYQTYTSNSIEPKFDWPFEQVFHFIINLAVGGHWPQYPDNTTVFPSELRVDYVRAYDISSTTVPRITGQTLVRINQSDEVYCLTNLVPNSAVTWSLPPGATGESSQGAAGDGGSAADECISVDFGTESGFVSAIVTSTCGEEEYSIPVHVSQFYETEVSFVGPDGTLDQSQFVESTGTYTQNGGDAVMYTRNRTEPYDFFQYSTTAITNPSLYVTSDRLFYMDVKKTTAAPCTRVIVQLEDSTLATPDNYPTGRHSRHFAYIEDKDDWQRLQFAFADRPDSSVVNVDRITVLIDSYMQREDVYLLRNFDSAAPGCTANCEELSANQCRTRAKSEKGACNDGFNNDWFGYDGDAPIDCDDADCWDDPVCTNAPPPPTPSVELCNDGIDNDNNGFTDCADEACASSAACSAWYEPACSSHAACAHEGPGDCCPNPIQGFLDCCPDNPASCSVHSECAARNLENECCPTSDGTFLDCCDLSLCVANPRCSGLDGPECCPTSDGTFLDCCEEKPDTCKIHPKCHELGLVGDCCGTPDGIFLDCCEPRQCTAHPACTNTDGEFLAGNCCPTIDGVYLDCCNLDLQDFQGSTMTYTLSVEGNSNQSSATATVEAPQFLLCALLVMLALL